MEQPSTFTAAGGVQPKRGYPILAGPSRYTCIMPEHGFLYTEKELKKLRKNLGRKPAEHVKGRGLCPFCGHLEARWASNPKSASEGLVEVRVLCSQCQRRAIYAIRAH